MSAGQLATLALLAACTAVFQRSMLTLARDTLSDVDRAKHRARALRLGEIAGAFLVALALALVLGHVR